jgi:rRNA maturation endonuclease Nob1
VIALLHIVCTACRRPHLATRPMAACACPFCGGTTRIVATDTPTQEIAA